LTEAEAELVAGYNVEYSGLFFALFFLAEYLNILLMSAFSSLLFFSGWISHIENVYLPLICKIFSDIFKQEDLLFISTIFDTLENFLSFFNHLEILSSLILSIKIALIFCVFV
jgi:NADH:ubiquinone oxidoreductase subunit H